MAELKIKADSGGGTVSFKGPATTTSNAAVQLTLPVDDGTANQYLQTNGSGVLSWNTVTIPAGGKIVQVKHATKTDVFTTASTSFVDITGLSATITPTSTSNYIAIWAFVNGNTTGSKSYGRIARDSTGIAIGDASGSKVRATFDLNNAGSSNRGLTAGGIWVEQAQSTSSTAYKIQARHENGGADLYINRIADNSDNAVAGRYSSSIIVMEFST